MANYFELILQNSGLNHITIKIFQNLDIDSLLNCAEVSPDWLQFIQENEVIWQQHFTTEFPLHEACKLGDLQKVKLLITIGININAKDTYDRTPLEIIIKWVRKPNLNIVEYLLTQPSIDINLQDNDGKTPLHWAGHIGHLNVVECLIKKVEIHKTS